MRINEILWQICDRFELAPSSLDLAAFEQQMSGIVDRENCLKKVLDVIRDDYDYVVIDCPPSVGLLTFNALRAATDVVVPVEMGYFSLHGLSKQLETLGVLCRQCDQRINVMVLPSMYDIRTKMARDFRMGIVPSVRLTPAYQVDTDNGQSGWYARVYGSSLG
jgi:chromosome partitioning protein